MGLGWYEEASISATMIKATRDHVQVTIDVC